MTTEPVSYRKHLTREGDSVVRGVVIHGIERMQNTENGNPSWRFMTNVGALMLHPDASLGYGVTNFARSEHDGKAPEIWLIGNPDQPKVDLLCSRVGQVQRVWALGVDGEVYRG